MGGERRGNGWAWSMRTSDRVSQVNGKVGDGGGGQEEGEGVSQVNLTAEV